MPAPESILQILSRQTVSDRLDCEDCLGIGEALVFDSENGHDYTECTACQGSGYNTLGLVMHGLVQPPEGGYGPQELKLALADAQQKTAEPALPAVAMALTRRSDQALANSGTSADRPSYRAPIRRQKQVC